MTDPDTAAISTAVGLDRREIDRFHRDGWLGPFAVRTPAEMACWPRVLADEILASDGPNPASRTHCRHLDRRDLFELVSDPAIVQRIAALLGNDLLLWTSGFWIKEGDGLGRRTPWHQDINYWPLEPQVNITAWIAMEDVGADNAPLRLIPGSHRRMLPHARVPGADHEFGEEADRSLVDDRLAVTCAMKAGQFIIFSERLLHGSEANRSPRRRVGLAARYTMACTKVFQDKDPIRFPAHRVIVVSGSDRFGFCRTGPPPAG